jgi:catechol 2,3-dioxygenase-like lactoylglutathione lyase family enzyme
LIDEVQFILFVDELARSRQFYAQLLRQEPLLDVPGMVQFRLGSGCLLGLMPRSGAERLGLQPSPVGYRQELYLRVDDPQGWWVRALQAGAREVLPLAERNWGDRAAYGLDPDGHLLVLASC